MEQREVSSNQSVDLDATLPLPESVSEKDELDRRIKHYRESRRKRLIFNYRKLNIRNGKTGKKGASALDIQFRLGTDVPEIDMKYIKKSESLMSSELQNSICLTAASWDFRYPPNAKARQHCARILFDSVGQPDNISMKKTNRGYEVCELSWNMKDKNSIPESFQNWEIIGRIDVALPNYIDTADGSVEFDSTYMASFKIVDRDTEVFTTAEWKKTPTNLLYTLNEFESISGRGRNQPPLTNFF